MWVGGGVFHNWPVTETIAGLGVSPLELGYVVAAVVLVGARWAPGRIRRVVRVAGVAGVVVLGAAVVVAGARWPLVPALAGGGVAVAFAVPGMVRWWAGRPERRAPWWLAVPGAALCAGLIVAGLVAAWALPRPVFPEPSGRYAVGTTVVQWSDSARPEEATADPGDRRTVVVQLWYPAQESPAEAARARYLGRTEREARLVARGVADHLGVPGFLLDEVPRARTHAVPGAAVAAGGERFPLVLFSPGLGGVRTQNTAWAEELASRGYVVAAVDHPYDSAAVVLADGRVIRTRLRATGDPEEDRRRAEGWTRIRAADLGFVLTRLGGLDRGEPPGALAGRLDTGRAAVAGHSLGGAAALLAARTDARFAAVVNLDGFPWDPEPGPFRQPALALTHPVQEGENPDYIPRLTRVLTLSRAAAYRVTVPGSAHLTFTDAPLYLPPLPALVGSPGRTAGPRMTAGATAEFLDATLRGGRGDLAARLAAYGEVTVHRPAGAGG